jgi:SNF2-related domain
MTRRAEGQGELAARTGGATPPTEAIPPRYKHQDEGLRRIKNRPTKPSDEDVFSLNCEMGTGKSRIIVDEWQERVEAKDLQDLLIIAPAGSYRNWDRSHPGEPSELDRWLVPALRARVRVGAWVSGANKGHRADLEDVLRASGRPRVVVCNVEALSSVDKAREACATFLETAKARGGAMCVVDESTRIRGDSNRTDAVIKLGRSARARRIMTGLITPRSPIDLFHQFAFLDWRILGQRNFWGFKMRYSVMEQVMIPYRNQEGELKERKVWQTVGYKNQEELQQRLAPYNYRVLKDDCLDLPKKIYLSKDVELTSKQWKAYREIKEYATTELSKNVHVTALSVIGQIQKLHHVTLGFVGDENKVIREFEHNRLRALCEVIEDHAEISDGKVVVWCCYHHSVHAVAAELRKQYGDKSVAVFFGGNRGSRGEDEQRFKQDPACRFMVATTAAGGVGNNWVQADLAVYYSNDYDLEHRAQSEDRIHRSGQTRGATYVDLIARGTVEEKIIAALRRKIDMATSITGENYRAWLV